MLRLKALKFADDIGLVDEKFKASAGWISSVLKQAERPEVKRRGCLEESKTLCTAVRSTDKPP